MVFGEPRFTNDIDIVVRMDERQARQLVAVQGADSLDWRYLEDWAGRLGVAAELEGIRP